MRTSDLGIPVFVVHLRRATKRLKHIQSELQKIGIRDHTIVEAIDGQTLDAQALRRYQQQIIDHKSLKAYSFMELYPMNHSWAQQLHVGHRILKRISTNEMACTLSNLKCFELLLQSQAPAAVVMEDDAVLHSDLPSVMQHIDHFPKNWQVVHAAYCQHTMFSPITNRYTRRKLATGHTMGQSCGANNAAICYFISRSGAAHHLRNLLGRYPNVENLCAALSQISQPEPLTKLFMQPWDNILFCDKIARYVYNFHYITPALATCTTESIVQSTIRTTTFDAEPQHAIERYLSRFLLFRALRSVIRLLRGHIGQSEFRSRIYMYRWMASYYLTSTWYSFCKPSSVRQLRK